MTYRLRFGPVLLSALVVGLLAGCASGARSTSDEHRYQASLDEAAIAVEHAFREAGLEIDEETRKDMSRAGRYYLEGFVSAPLSGGGYSGRPVRVVRISAALQLEVDGTVSVRVRNEQGEDVRLPGGSDPSERTSGDRYVRQVLESLDERLPRVETAAGGG